MKITTSLLIGTIKIARNLTTSFSQSHNLDKTICINFASCVRVVSFFGVFLGQPNCTFPFTVKIEILKSNSKSMSFVVCITDLLENSIGGFDPFTCDL